MWDNLTIRQRISVRLSDVLCEKSLSICLKIEREDQTLATFTHLHTWLMHMQLDNCYKTVM